MKPNTPRNSVSLTEGKRSELLDRLDGRTVSGDGDRAARRGSERRTDRRYEYRQRDIGLKVEHLGGGVSQLLVSGRNLSSGGIGFLHGAYLHPGSKCSLELVANGGRLEHVDGQVVSCRHVEGIVHEVGVQFDRRIDPTSFVGSAAGNGGTGLDSMEVPRIVGRLVYVEDAQAEAALMMHFLKPTGLEVVQARTPGAAIDAVKRGSIDYVFTDLVLDGADGIDLIQRLREMRFAGPIVVVTAESDPRQLHAATAAGADELLSLPFNASELYVLLQQLQDRVSGLHGGKLFSTRSNDKSMAQLIDEFIKDASKRADQLQKAAEEQQLDTIRSLCVQLKGSAPAYGYEPLGDVAGRVVAMLDDRQDLESTIGELRRLVIMCQSLGVREG